MATDRRTKYTKTVIRQALFDLLQEKPINKITVTDVCKLADINRSTFYSHYEDVYALLASIQNELFENVVLTLTTENWFEEVLQLVDQNKDLCQALIGPHGDSSFIRQLIYLGYDNSMKFWKKMYPNASPETRDYAYAFVSNGVIGILENWVCSGYKLGIDEVGKILMGLRQYETAHQSFREAVRRDPDNHKYREGALDAALAMKKNRPLAQKLRDALGRK